MKKSLDTMPTKDGALGHLLGVGCNVKQITRDYENMSVDIQRLKEKFKDDIISYIFNFEVLHNITWNLNDDLSLSCVFSSMRDKKLVNMINGYFPKGVRIPVTNTEKNIASIAFSYSLRDITITGRSNLDNISKFLTFVITEWKGKIKKNKTVILNMERDIEYLEGKIKKDKDILTLIKTFR